MKILNVNMSLDPVTGGGTAERTFQISRFLVEVGVDCTILTTDQGLGEMRTDQILSAGIKLKVLPCILPRFYLPVFSWKRLCALVSEADIVHLMTHWTVLNALVQRACIHTTTPYVFCPAGTLEIFGRSAFKKKLYNIIVGRRIVSDAAAHIAIPHNEVHTFRPFGIKPEDVTVIPNGVDVAEFQSRHENHFRQKYGIGGHPFIFFIGRLSYEKGLDLLIKAFAEVAKKFHNYHLVLAGPDNGLLDRLQKLALTKHVSEKVHFTGYLGGEDKSQALHAANLLAVPSRTEAMSIVALEAGACGTPVLMTDVCGFDRVTDINGGRIVTANQSGIQKGLEEMLAAPAALTEMGVNLKKEVLSTYTWQAVANQYIELYQGILLEKTC